jgi:indole-3-glycerol phosphate synthase
MSILDTLVQRAAADARARHATAPEAALMQRPAFHAPTLSLARALRRPDGPAFIAECKRASPSEGTLRADYSAPDIARAYKTAAAAAISVLTEPGSFGGSLADLAAVRHAVDLPLLRKDFLVDPYQIVEARAFGADAVLLIAAALDAPRLHDLLDAARDLGLGVLVEVHSAAELDALDLDRIDVLGVNHRDLRTFEIDLSLSPTLFARLPERIVRVAESGVTSADACARLREAGADAFLVGTAFMRAPDPGRALAALRRETALALAARAAAPAGDGALTPSPALR